MFDRIGGNACRAGNFVGDKTCVAAEFYLFIQQHPSGGGFNGAVVGDVAGKNEVRRLVYINGSAVLD